MKETIKVLIFCVLFFTFFFFLSFSEFIRGLGILGCLVVIFNFFVMRFRERD